MPSQNPILVALRGSAEYAQALDRLREAEGLETNHQLAEFALAELGRRRKLKLPPRSRNPSHRPRRSPPPA